MDLFLALSRQAAPGQTVAIDQLGPVKLLRPFSSSGLIKSGLFEIVKSDSDTMLCQPFARLSYRVAAGYAI